MCDILNSMTYAWMTFALFFLLLEIGSPGLFFFIAFFFGGIGAAIASLCTMSLVEQLFIFFGVTSIALVVLRYVILPRIGKSHTHERTNVYALQGKHGFVIQTISPQKSGMVTINGAKWFACALHGQTITQGDEIEVVDIRGAHLIVKKYIRSRP